MTTSSNNQNASTVATQTVGFLDTEQLIARGRYDYVDSTVKGKMPVQSAEYVFGLEPKVFQIDRKLDPQAEMAKVGYRPATVWDLLEYGANNPDEQLLYPIAALGTDIKVSFSADVSVIAYLSGDGHRRSLCADWGFGTDFEVEDEIDGGYQSYLSRVRYLGVKI